VSGENGRADVMDVEQLKREILYRGKVFDLIVDHVRYPSGSTGIREIAHHLGGAVVVPLADDRTVLLVEQLRYPLGRRILELPAGKLFPGEDPLLAARRELEEETGWSAGRMEKLASFYTTPGFCDEELHLYLGRELRRTVQGPHREEGEHGMTVHAIPFAEAVAMAKRGKIPDGKTIVGLLLASEHLAEEDRRSRQEQNG
jgi:ADP-ribose pyrophosphatase